MCGTASSDACGKEMKGWSLGISLQHCIPSCLVLYTSSVHRYLIASCVCGSGDRIKTSAPHHRGGDDDTHDFDDLLGDTAPAAPPGDAAPQKKKKRSRRPKQGTEHGADGAHTGVDIVMQPPKAQADWLWTSLSASSGPPPPERKGLVPSSLARLAHASSLEAELCTLSPHWRKLFCGTQDGTEARGSPALLFVSPAALAAAVFVRLCPTFNKVCDIGSICGL